MVVGMIGGVCTNNLDSWSDSSSKIRLTFWAMGFEGEKVEEMIPGFQRMNPGIEVEVQAIPWSASHEKLLTAFAGNSTPDICQLGNTWIPEFQAIGSLYALDSMIQQSGVIDPDQFFQGIWETNRMGGQVWGIPWYVDTRLVFYRTDILKEVGYLQAPETWQGWLEVSQAIKHRYPDRYSAFFSLVHGDWQIPALMILHYGGSLLKEQNQWGAFDDPATIRALTLYIQFFKQGLAPRDMTRITNIYQGFEEGYFAWMVTGPWNVGEIRNRIPKLEGRWSTAMLPGESRRFSTAGGSSLVMFKSTRYPAEAWRFIEYLTRSETQAEFYRLTQDLPAVKSAWQKAGITHDSIMLPFYHQLESVAPSPKIAEWEMTAIKMQEHLDRVIFERIDLPDMIPELNRDIDYLLEKRRYLLERGLIPAE